LKKQLVTVRELTDKEIENEKRTAALTIEAEKDKSAKKEAELRAQIAEAENERKTKEFEQARQLQLSMLPKEIPSLPNLDIAVYMKTATEVGGDYYDFCITEGDTLTAVLGDATGHGMNAGMMVSVTKGLFQNLAAQTDLKHIISQFNNSLISMHLQPMYMTLNLIRINNSQLQSVGASMPPFLYFQSRTKSVLEIESSGPPLGGFPDFNYEIENHTLSAGDLIVLMSDGFAERMNEKKEFFGWNKGRELLASMVDLTADQIINEFVKASDEWGRDREQDDDITFVVFKVK
jgi:serine phosphatase RsbU (regulator of sigma subunit)